MYNFFNSKNPLLSILFPIFSAVLLFNLPTELILSYPEENRTFLYSALLQTFGDASFAIVYKIVSAALLAFNAIFFSRLIIQIKFFDIYNNFHGFVFLFIYGLLIWFTDTLPLLIAGVFFLIALSLLLKTLRKKYALLEIFNVGFLLSIASFFRFELLYYFPFILISLLILRSLNLREWMIALIGLITPYFIGISFYYFFNSDFGIIGQFGDLIMYKEKAVELNLITVISLAVIALITFVISVNLFSRYRSRETDIQDYMRVFFMIFLFSAIFFFLVQGTEFTAASLSVFAITIPISIFFKSIKRKILREILFDIFFLCLLFSQLEFFRMMKF